MKLNELTINEASLGLEEGKFTSREIVSSIFSHIKEVEPKVGAYITLTEEEAFRAADESDRRRKKKAALGKLDGIPIAVKDLFLTKGVKTTAASKILENHIPVYESTVTKKLWGAGAVLVGKTNLDQFAMGSSTETSAYSTATEYNSTTRNPWNLECVPGGSSGGSAAAVAADMCLGAIGTDTGGSIRQPASLCGITGLKPTYGRVSRYGTIAMASSLDQAGPMTKDVVDAALILNAISGHDLYDSTSSTKTVPNYTEFLDRDIKGIKIGLPMEFFGEGIDADVLKSVTKAIDTLKSLGVEVVNVSMPVLKYALAVYYILMPAEVSSNLARYDGIRYGLSMMRDDSFSGSIDDVYKLSREKGFGAETKRRIMLGSYVLSAGYYDAYYKKAQKVRTMVKDEFDRVFKEVDLLATPVTPTPAFRMGEKLADPLSMYLSDIMTVPANPAGIPAISVPAGLAHGLPVGIQLMGPAWGEGKILQVASQFQSNTNWHKEKPNLQNN